MVDFNSLYVKLATKSPFSLTFAYIDKVDHAGNCLDRAGIPHRLLSYYIADDKRGEDALAIFIVKIKKRHENAFYTAMKELDKNSYLLGWGDSESAKLIKHDIHSIEAEAKGEI